MVQILEGGKLGILRVAARVDHARMLVIQRPSTGSDMRLAGHSRCQLDRLRSDPLQPAMSAQMCTAHRGSTMTPTFDASTTLAPRSARLARRSRAHPTMHPGARVIRARALVRAFARARACAYPCAELFCKRRCLKGQRP